MTGSKIKDKPAVPSVSVVPLEWVMVDAVLVEDRGLHSYLNQHAGHHEVGKQNDDKHFLQECHQKLLPPASLHHHVLRKICLPTLYTERMQNR